MSRPAGRRGALLGRTLRLGSLLLAGAGSLLFLALFILSSRDLDRQQQSFGHAATTEAWVVHQLAIQFQKLQRVLALAQTGAGGTATAPGTDPAAAVAIQADLLWSRIDLLTSGPEVGTLGALPETREVQAALRHALERLEHLLPAIGRGEPAAIAEAGALLAAQEDAVGRYAQDMLHRAPKAVRADLQAQSAQIELYLAVMLLLGLVFVLSLGDEIRRNRRLARMARQSLELAQHESAAKSVFLATVSHEIRTPLNAISGFAELIERQPYGPVGNEKYLEYAQDIIASTAHLCGLLDDVTDAQMVLQGQISLQDEEIELRSFLAETLRIVRANCAGRYLPPRIDTRVVAVTLRADRRRLRQVLINLVTNAIRYSEGQAEIRIEAGLAAGDLCIAVSDQGRGIPEADVERVFQPFQRGQQPAGTGAPGMGLGLTIVRSIMAAHGGSVRLESAAGSGTTVTLLIPADRVGRERPPGLSMMQGVAAE